jgi:hypothetical protein
MSDATDPPQDPAGGLDPEVLAILAARQGQPAGAGGVDPDGWAHAVGGSPHVQPGSHEDPDRLPRSARWASWAAGAVMALVVVLGAALDPSGLAAPVAWSGARPAVEPWTWLQHVLLGPAIVLLVWWWTRQLLRGATPAAPRRWVLTRTWLIVVLGMMLAKLVYSVVLMAPALVGGAADGMPAASSGTYLVWATGLTGVKALLLGWLPGLAAALLWSPGPARRAGRAPVVAEPTLALPPTAVVVAGLAAIGPWAAQQWWTGSPVGYAHPTDWRLLAPVAAGGRLAWIVSLVLLWLLMAASLRATLRRVEAPRSGSVQALAGAMAAPAGLLALSVAQSAVALLFGTDLPGGDDLWILPSTYLRLVEALSFGLLVAPASALAALLVPRTPRPQWSWVAAVAAPSSRGRWSWWCGPAPARPRCPPWPALTQRPSPSRPVRSPRQAR